MYCKHVNVVFRLLVDENMPSTFLLQGENMELYQSSYLLILVLAAAALVTGSENSSKKKNKLQIGVKKRVDPENCPIKSKKGDVLHMHYTVSKPCTGLA